MSEICAYGWFSASAKIYREKMATASLETWNLQCDRWLFVLLTSKNLAKIPYWLRLPEVKADVGARPGMICGHCEWTVEWKTPDAVKQMERRRIFDFIGYIL